MFSSSDDGGRQFDLARAAHSTAAITPDLLRRVIAASCPRTRSLAQAGHTSRLQQLIGAQAWMDACLELLACELPTWTLRRLVQTDGLWHCSLSRQPQLPVELDDMAEARHEEASLAILEAVIEARRLAAPQADAFRSSSDRQPRAMAGIRLGCDNFI